VTFLEGLYIFEDGDLLVLMNAKNILSALIIFLSFLAGSFSRAELPVGQRFKKVIWVIFENTNYDAALAQPDFMRVAGQGALLTQMAAETHPSQPNYIAMIAGSTLGVRSNKNVNLSESHVGDLLEKAGLDWKAYAEDYPGNCFLGAESGLYARKHVPFLSFTNVTKSASRCQKIVSASSFATDFQAGHLPAFSMYIPNLKNDGHDTNIDYAGKWLTAKFGNVFKSPASLQDTLFVVTFDENHKGSSNQIFTVLLGGSVTPGIRNGQALNHVALLKMVQDEFNLGNQGREDLTAPAITGIWRSED
jgi:hypothetical protein